ncbi:MAG: thiolase family protein [Deltaproteobacteria bacterium]|nr:thiolase family protein [Deltaproteobacteria bacterium]
MPGDFKRLRELKDSIAIVGVGASRQGTFPELDHYTLGIEALHNALGDCGLALKDIDGLIVQGPGDISFVRMGEMLGLNPIYGANFDVGGLGTIPLVQQAAMVLHSGLCQNIALIYGNCSRTEGRKFGGQTTVSPGREYSSAFYYYGLTSPGAASAFQARLHFETYGTTSEQLATVPVVQRRHAMLNPLAIKREPLTVEMHQKSRFIVEPLHLYDYCLINDGGVALIMTTAERARDLNKKPIYISGIGRQDTYQGSSLPNHRLWRETMPKAAEMAYGMAGVTQRDIDALMVYDSFSINIWISLENFGFCKPGEAGDFTQGGRIELGGELPINTHGGHLSESYMQGWLHHVEAVRQLRRECGPRQVKDAEVIQFICRGNLASTVIYRR